MEISQCNAEIAVVAGAVRRDQAVCSILEDACVQCSLRYRSQFLRVLRSAVQLSVARDTAGHLLKKPGIVGDIASGLVVNEYCGGGEG